MKTATKRYVAIALALTLVLSTAALADTTSTTDEAAVKVVAEQFFDAYMDAMVLKSHPNFSHIFDDTVNTGLYGIMINYEIDNAILQSAGFRSYEYSLDYTSLSVNGSTANVQLTQNATIHFESFPADVPSYRHLSFEFNLQKSDNVWKIADIVSNHIVFTGFLAGLNAETVAAQRSSSNTILFDAAEQANSWLPPMEATSNAALSFLREGNRDSKETIRKVVDETATPKQITVPMTVNAVTKSFDVDVAKAYADKYHETYNAGEGLFKANSEDCQNFLSQILWAGYGGWTESDTTATMKNNIKTRLRMFYNNGAYGTAWYGNSGGGSGPWENVTGHWNFIEDASRTYGPQGNQYNGELLYTNLAASSIYEGNGLQLRNGKLGNGGNGKYDHSIFVVYHGPNPYVYSAIGVAAHSTDYQNEPLTTLIAGFGGSNCYMRAISYLRATFES